MAASFAATAVVLLTAVTGVSTASAVREGKFRRATERAERQARERLIQSLVSVARFERISGNPGARGRALGAIREALGNGANAEERRLLRDEAASCLLISDVELVREQSMAYPTPGWLLPGEFASRPMRRGTSSVYSTIWVVGPRRITWRSRR